MPWKESGVMDEKKAFIEAYFDKDEDRTMTELCEWFGISRNTGHETIRRFRLEGEAGLKPRSRAPHVHPNATAPEVVGVLVKVRKAHPRWGPRKIIAFLERKGFEMELPAASTVGGILKREGFVGSRKRRRRTPPYQQPFAEATEPNDVWCADFKGWFRTQDGERCDPFTLSDACSRFLLRLDRVARMDYEETRKRFELAFREYGLPWAIRTDNGTPFASTAVGGLTRLSVWWLTLGIQPERIDLGKPQQNGRHERMHLTLKEETASPPKCSCRAQQRAFNRFTKEYNFERPHEAIGQQCPGDVYRPSYRPYEKRPKPVEYPPHFSVRMMHHDGAFKWKGKYVYLSEALIGQPVGFKQETDRIWKVFFGPIYLAEFDTHTMKIIRPKTSRRQKKSKND